MSFQVRPSWEKYILFVCVLFAERLACKYQNKQSQSRDFHMKDIHP